MFTDKTTQSVADAVKKIMEADAQKKVEEALIGNQKNIDKNHNNKIDAQDFKILKGQKKAVKEEEQIDEIKLADLTPRKIEGKSYGKNYVDPEGADDAADMKSKKKVSKGTYASRATRGFETPASRAKKDAKIAMRRESFTDLLNSYQENGIKGLFEKLEYVEEEILDEEPSNDEFTAELQDAKAKAEGKGKKAEVAKPSNEEVEQIEERTLTAAETGKKEEIVKSMKKGLAGFKERYGKDAKSVMYATATKQAKLKEETESKHYEAGHEYASDHAQDSGFKVTARARKKEMLADNPHKKGTTEHSDWHRGALDGHQTALDNM